MVREPVQWPMRSWLTLSLPPTEPYAHSYRSIGRTTVDPLDATYAGLILPMIYILNLKNIWRKTSCDHVTNLKKIFFIDNRYSWMSYVTTPFFRQLSELMLQTFCTGYHEYIKMHNLIFFIQFTTKLCCLYGIFTHKLGDQLNKWCHMNK